MVIARPQRYKDSLQAHYTSSRNVVTYMVSRLKPTDEDHIWEPCSGGGDLIDGIIERVPNAHIRASEIDEKAFVFLRDKYRAFPHIEVVQEDALELGANPLLDPEFHFTRVIANPPYGAYQSQERRTMLKSRYHGLYVRDTYGVILYHCFNLLEPKGRLVFIIPDTFLWLHRHDFLRRTLLAKSTVEEIALFPSKFFPGISFGYSGLCIITLTKSPTLKIHRIRVIEDLHDEDALMDLARANSLDGRCSIGYVQQQEVLFRPHVELIRPSYSGGIVLNARANSTLGDIAEVRTGFYSGNDRNWVRRANENVPRSKNFLDVEKERISRCEHPSLEGMDKHRCFIPILRGGAARFIRPTLWYVDWSINAVSEYRKPGENPARFQNSKFYFKEGIGVPMVASTRLTAALLERRLFDQGIVGIFPNDERLLKYLLGFLNTELATILLRQINPTANNSANYMKRMPFVMPTQFELRECETKVTKAIEEVRQLGEVSQEILREIEAVYRAIWEQTKSQVLKL